MEDDPPPQIPPDDRFSWFAIAVVGCIIIFAFVIILFVWLGSPG
jgi:hypothetical protein